MKRIRDGTEARLMLMAMGVPAGLLMGALCLIVLALLLEMLAYVYGIPLLAVTAGMERLGLAALAAAVMAGGALGAAGLAVNALAGAGEQRPARHKRKRKNRARLTVEEVLADMLPLEREWLREKLAEARLGIREDGMFVPLERLEQADGAEKSEG